LIAHLDLHIHRWFKLFTACAQSDITGSTECNSMKRHGIGGIALGIGALCTSVAMTGAALAAPDPGKKACAKEARIICPAEMKSLSRKKVEACMIKNVEKTSPICKSAMYRIKAEREAKAKRQASAQAGTSE